MNFNWSHITLLLSSLAVIAVWATSVISTRHKAVEKIHYSIQSAEGARKLITTQEIKNKVDEIYDLDAAQIKISELKLDQLEAIISKDNRVLDTQIHLDAKRELYITVLQRKPIVRIIDEAGDQYYLDQEGAYISKQDFKAIRVPIATGQIEAFSEDWKMKSGKIKDTYSIIEALGKDKFFTALIEQIHFENDRIKLIPKMGSEVIVINDLSHLDKKLQNLKLFYKTEMTHNNAWGKYDELDISWKNQVVPRTINP